MAASGCARREPKILIGKAAPTPAAILPPVDPGPPEQPLPAALVPEPALNKASSSGPPGAVPFLGAVNVPADLRFFLVIGSDARPGQSVARSRADSIHVVAVDPRTRHGTVLGLPRDAYVQVPGHGREKITAALALGGPKLLVDSVRQLTGLPVEYYALTGFEGIVAMVDELGGLDVYVAERMNDAASEARFERGWHHMDGRQVLAFTRNRHVDGGDFTRSRHQGQVILHALEKARAVVADQGGVRQWLNILYRHARVDLGLEDAVPLATLARSIDPADVVNVVASGEVRTVDRQSVVLLDEAAYALFRDVGADAVADGRLERPTPTPEPVTPEPATPQPPTPTPTTAAESPSPTPATPASSASPMPTASPGLLNP